MQRSAAHKMRLRSRPNGATTSQPEINKQGSRNRSSVLVSVHAVMHGFEIGLKTQEFESFR